MRLFQLRLTSSKSFTGTAFQLTFTTGYKWKHCPLAINPYYILNIRTGFTYKLCITSQILSVPSISLCAQVTIGGWRRFGFRFTITQNKSLGGRLISRLCANCLATKQTALSFFAGSMCVGPGLNQTWLYLLKKLYLITRLA